MSLSKAKGFTVFELMITVTIAAVLAAVAIPNFQDMMARNRVSSSTEELVNSIATARNTAVQRRRTVVLRPDTTGWTIRMDTSAGPLVMRQRFDARMGIAIDVTAKELSFRPSGIVQRSATAGLNGTITVCDATSRREVGKDIVVNPIGRIITRNHANVSVCNP
jgi:type IV fimbrial biogenesis protein FimT